MSRHWLGRSLAIFVLACTAISGAPRADDVADFFKGKQVTLIIGYGPGGGYDVYGRTVARHIGRFIPGEPTVVVQNMPGAGSLVAVNHLYNSAVKDGTVIATFAREMPMMGILGGNPNAKYDPKRFTWLGTPSSSEEDAYLMFARKDAPVQKIEEAIGPGAKELVLSSTAAGAAGNEWAVLLRDVLGLNVKLIAGYPDSNAQFLAIERGEVHGRSLDYSAVRSSQPQWLRPDSQVRLLLQFGRADRHRDFPDVPTARELAKTDFARRLIEVADLSNTLARPFAAPPGVPEARAKALVAAFMAACKDPQFLAEAQKMQIEISPIDGNEVRRRIDKLSQSAPDLLDYLRKLRSENKG